jgi:hypothetical protein
LSESFFYRYLLGVFCSAEEAAQARICHEAKQCHAAEKEQRFRIAATQEQEQVLEEQRWRAAEEQGLAEACFRREQQHTQQVQEQLRQEEQRRQVALETLRRKQEADAARLKEAEQEQRQRLLHQQPA